MTEEKLPQKFFVYGSMTQGFVHFQRIQEFITQTQSAFMKGSVYRLQVGFPVVLEQGQDSIPGQLVTLQSNDLLFSLLDQFHGYDVQDEARSLYFRRRLSVATEQGTEEVWVYVLNPAKLPKTAVRIADGDWLQSLQQSPALTAQLTERQVTYIQRLGASKGREIVPIDLPLYRELMNLEIIVDKGRRLALSKLGNEVFRYLG